LDARVQEKAKKTMTQFKTPEDITINTFGIGFDHDAQLLSDIAGLRDGNFYYIPDYYKINEAFVDCLGGLLSSVCRNAQLTIKPEQSNILKGVDIVRAYGEAATWANENENFVTKMTSLVCGKTKNFVLELRIPINKKELEDNEKNIKVARAELQIIGLNGEVVTKAANLHITLLDEEEDLKDEEDDDREVMKHFYRVKAASLLPQAMKLADQKKFDDAAKVLANFKEELENSLLKRQEFVKNLIVDIQRAIQDVNALTYEQAGKKNLIANAKAQMFERSNFATENIYQNDIQTKMLDEVQVMRNNSETRSFRE